jgi:hypothetical protein
MEILFLGCHFKWTLLLADVQFPILGVGFLCQLHLMVDPAANCLVDATSHQVLSTVSSVS